MHRGSEHTTPVPFNLTQPKIRLVPPPDDIIDTVIKANKVPASTYSDSSKLVDRLAIDKAKDANRLRMKAQYSNPRVQPFKLLVSAEGRLRLPRLPVGDALR